MDKRPFGKTAIDVTPLGFGAAPIGYLETEQQQIAEILAFLLDQGLNVIDTAAAYAGSEEAIGRAVADRRDEYVLVSKCGRAMADVPGESWSPDVIRGTVDRSLRRLRTDRLDVMLLHSCDQATLERGDTIGALVEAQQAGKVRFIGYSGDNEAAAYAAGVDAVTVIETSLNICDQRNIDLILPVTQQHNVGVIAKRPIANAAWKPQSQQRGLYADYAAEYADRLQAMRLDISDVGFNGPAEEVWPELALRFTLSLEGVHTAIVGTTNPRHLKANLAAAEKGPLPQEIVEQLRNAFLNAETQSGQPWPGLM